MNNTTVTTYPTEIITVTDLEIVLMSTLYPTLLLLYCLILYILISKNDTKFRNSYYTLAIGLGVNDIAMLACTLYEFAYDLIGYAYMGETVDTFIGFVLFMTCGWYSSQIYILMIAVNRFMAVTFFDLYRRLATVRVSMFTIIATTVMAFCITTPTLVVCGYAYTPMFKVHLVRNFFDPKCFQYFIDVFKPFDSYFTYVIAGGACLLYTISATYSVYKRRTFAASDARKSYTREMKLLAQGLVQTLILCTIDVIHWMSPPALLNRTVTWLYCGLNPVIYLALDRNLRTKVIELVSSSKQKILQTSFGLKNVRTTTTTTSTITPVG